MQSSKKLSKYLSSIFNYSLNRFTRALRLYPAGHSKTQSLASVVKPTEEFKNNNGIMPFRRSDMLSVSSVNLFGSKTADQGYCPF